MKLIPGGDLRGGQPSRLARLLTAGIGTMFAVEIGRGVPALANHTWQRTNHRGQEVSLVAGPICALSASLVGASQLPRGLRRPVLLLGLVSGAVGVYDDIAGARPAQAAYKGFRGHLLALRSGTISTGVLKIVGVVGASIAAAGSISRGPLDRLVAAGVMAGMANLVNLLDLRPGRAAKTSALVAAATLGGPAGGLSTAVLGTSAGVLPADLGEKVMLGDGGANALGALLGFRLAAGTRPTVRASILALLVLLTAASEKVSFTKVIEATPGLRDLDRWGRLPSHPAATAGA